MCDPLTAALGVGQLLMSVINGNKQAEGAKSNAEATNRAADQSAQNAEAQNKIAQDQAVKQEQELNRKNAKRADAGSIAADGAQAAQDGGASTMLTGPMGVDPKSLALGKPSVLGA